MGMVTKISETCEASPWVFDSFFFKTPPFSDANSVSLFDSRRDKAAAEREYKKAKNLKKKQRMKELEEQREKEKSKWQNFNTKVFFSSLVFSYLVILLAFGT